MQTTLVGRVVVHKSHGSCIVVAVMWANGFVVLLQPLRGNLVEGMARDCEIAGA